MTNKKIKMKNGAVRLSVLSGFGQLRTALGQHLKRDVHFFSLKSGQSDSTDSTDSTFF
jgi:hypothetical protein